MRSIVHGLSQPLLEVRRWLRDTATQALHAPTIGLPLNLSSTYCNPTPKSATAGARWLLPLPGFTAGQGVGEQRRLGPARAPVLNQAPGLLVRDENRR